MSTNRTTANDPQAPRTVFAHTGLFSALAANLEEGVIMVDAHGIITHVSPFCEQLFGQESAALVGKPLSALTPVVSAHESDIIAAYEEKLRQSKADLDEFVYTVTHDLNEPLRGICGYSHMVDKDFSEQIGSEGKEKLKTLTHFSLRLGDMIEALLTFSRCGSDESATASHSMSTLAARARDFFIARMAGGTLRITIQPDMPRLLCDGSRIAQVFALLMDNGIKFNDSPIKTVEAGCLPEGTATTPGPVFFVRDNGIGIDSKFHACVFKIFKRLHPKGAYGGGVGCGLAIARKIIERGGGKIWISSEENKGTTVFFTVGHA